MVQGLGETKLGAGCEPRRLLAREHPVLWTDVERGNRQTSIETLVWLES
jgi:hypothetical protein